MDPPALVTRLNFRCGPIPVVGAQFHEQGHPMRRVNLVGKVLVGGSLAPAGSLFDRALDIVVRHVGRAAFEQGHAQARVHVGIAAGELCGDGDFLAELGKNLAAFGVNGALEVFYLRPFAMSGHRKEFKLKLSNPE